MGGVRRLAGGGAASCSLSFAFAAEGGLAQQLGQRIVKAAEVGDGMLTPIRLGGMLPGPPTRCFEQRHWLPGTWMIKGGVGRQVRVPV